MDKEIIRGFICCGEYMVIVKLENSAHVMSYDEWKSVYGKLHPERWDDIRMEDDKKTA